MKKSKHILLLFLGGGGRVFWGQFHKFASSRMASKTILKPGRKKKNRGQYRPNSLNHLGLFSLSQRPRSKSCFEGILIANHILYPPFQSIAFPITLFPNLTGAALWRFIVAMESNGILQLCRAVLIREDV